MKLDYVKLLRDMAKEVEEHADEIIGQLDRVAEMTVSIRLEPNSIPMLDVHRIYHPWKLAEIMHNAWNDKEADDGQE